MLHAPVHRRSGESQSYTIHLLAPAYRCGSERSLQGYGFRFTTPTAGISEWYGVSGRGAPNGCADLYTGFPDLRLQKGNILHAPSTTAAPESDLRSSDVPTLISGSTDPATNQDPVGHYIYNSRNHEFRFSNDLPIKDPGETRAVTANLSQAVLASVAEEPSSGGDEYDVEWNAFIYNDAVEESEAQ